ncbi:uncharacterized protein LOC131264671 [Anopheles coustani]|uniref:uncharacterized protein LOC131264671 n=1 Tax=Anopheles coustani TaxID=139045 RepID=UPI00265B5847|nr:uncharacterized protein LOC131264671 [Anopheles coustani]
MIFVDTDSVLSYVVLVLICLVLYLLWFVATNGTRYWKHAQLPYIVGWPVVGNFLEAVLMRKSMFDLMEALYTDSHVKGSRLFGVCRLVTPTVIVRDPELIRQMLIKDATFFINRTMCTDPHSDPIGYYNLLMIQNPAWKQLRSYLTPTLSLSKIKQMYPLLEQVADDMVGSVNVLPIIRSSVRETEFKELSARFTTDVIASTFFGIQANCLKDETSEFRYYGRKIFDYGPARGMAMASFFFMPEIVPYLRLKLFPRDTEAFLKSIITQEIARREASGENRGDFIDSMITLQKNNAFIGVNEKIPLKGDLLVAQAATFYMASFETTSSVLSFALYELTKHSDIQARLREEIRDMVDKYGKNIPYEALANEMPYLGMVISETARLYPVLPFLERRCTLPEGVSGYKLEPFHEFVVPNGMPVLIPIHAIHRDPKYFPNPLKFNPERFAKENLDQIQPCTYMPFGVGPRTCLGSHFGTLQIKIALVKLLSKYRIDRSPSTPEVLTYKKNAFTLQSNEGLHADLVEDDMFHQIGHQSSVHGTFVHRDATTAGDYTTAQVLRTQSAMDINGDIIQIETMIFVDTDSAPSYVVLVLICLVLYLLWFGATNGTRYWKHAQLPYIVGWPVVGNFLEAVLMRKSMFDLMEALYTDSHVKGSRLFGVCRLVTPTIIVRDPELIRQMLIKDATFFMNRTVCTDPHNDPIGYYNLLMIQNPAWKQLRSYLTPTLSLSKLKQMYPLLEQVADDMVGSVNVLPIIRSSVRETEFKELSARFTTDVIASTFFGMQANCLKDETSDFRYYGRKIFNYGPARGMAMASFFFMPQIVPYLRLKLFPRDTEAFLKSIVTQEIARREASGESRGDFIDSMITLQKNNAFIGVNEKIPLKGDLLVAQAATFYMASFETTSSVLSFALYELTKHSDIQARLREEIRDMVDKYGKNIPYEALANEMPYLGMVISETARLYPALPLLERRCTLPEGVSGYKLEPFHEFVVPNGMPVLIPIHAIHRDPKYFPNPLKFDPERFAKENLDQIQPCTYMPFGVGPRTCVGSLFATLQIKIALVKLLSKYRIDRSPSTPEVLTYKKIAFTLQSNEGLHADLVEDDM